MATKVCKKCKRRLPETAFYKSRITDDGLYWYCKECELKRCEKRRRRAGMQKQPKAKPKLTLKQTIAALYQALEVSTSALQLANIEQLDSSIAKKVVALSKEALEAAKPRVVNPNVK
jgi:hypothetical protein